MEKKKRVLNALGEYLEKRSVNKAQVSRRTGIHQTRMTWLCYESIHYLRSSELELIAKAINENGYEMHKDLFDDLELKEEFTPSEKVINNITKELTEKNLISQFSLTTQDIKRISEFLPFCQEEKLESELLSHLGLKRKSAKMTATIKACVEADWLKLQQKNTEEGLLSYYIITEHGKKILEIE
ncbi:helix-turn-helix domain-containing protein [Sphingobacterium tabacisoli]|uniref:Helix-turn-helix domain-containing protein n=1 Tax=Sphingobacterium tabacisoli TaxID=2044855 RepID=A0ABW5L9C3_9SPHI|nr:helix-turn-helix transcriptional regulator [Sphingobacterium tabacisoli]